MSDRAPSPPTPLARRYVRYVLGFTVGVAVGLAPFLGALDVPLFAPLLSMFPDKLRPFALPLSSFVMGLMAVGVQFAAGEEVSRRWLRRTFLRTFVAILVGVVVVAVLYTAVVRTVPAARVEGEGNVYIPLVVGFVRPDPPPGACLCEPRLSDIECIVRVGFDNVDACWGRQVMWSRLLLVLSYLFLTGGFGALIGLLLLQEGSRRKARRTGGR